MKYYIVITGGKLKLSDTGNQSFQGKDILDKGSHYRVFFNDDGYREASSIANDINGVLLSFESTAVGIREIGGLSYIVHAHCAETVFKVQANFDHSYRQLRKISFDPTAQIRQFLLGNGLSEGQIQSYLTPFSESIPERYGTDIVCAINLLRWLANRCLTPLEQALIIYIAVTLDTGNLRERVFEAYKNHQGSSYKSHKEWLEDLLYLLDYAVGRASDRLFSTEKGKNLVNFLVRDIGPSLRLHDFNPLADATFQETLRAFSDGEYIPPIFDPTDAIRKYLRTEKKLSDTEIDSYLQNRALLTSKTSEGIIRAVNLLRWLAKPGITDQEKHLINYFALTYQYATWSFVIKGSLRKAIWEAFEAFLPTGNRLELNELDRYFYENGLKPIISTYQSGNGLSAESLATLPIKILRDRIGGALANHKFNPVTDEIMNNAIKDLIAGTFDPTPQAAQTAVPIP